MMKPKVTKAEVEAVELDAADENLIRQMEEDAEERKQRRGSRG